MASTYLPAVTFASQVTYANQIQGPPPYSSVVVTAASGGSYISGYGGLNQARQGNSFLPNQLPVSIVAGAPVAQLSNVVAGSSMQPRVSNPMNSRVLPTLLPRSQISATRPSQNDAVITRPSDRQRSSVGLRLRTNLQTQQNFPPPVCVATAVPSDQYRSSSAEHASLQRIQPGPTVTSNAVATSADTFYYYGASGDNGPVSEGNSLNIAPIVIAPRDDLDDDDVMIIDPPSPDHNRRFLRLIGETLNNCSDRSLVSENNIQSVSPVVAPAEDSWAGRVVQPLLAFTASSVSDQSNQLATVSSSASTVAALSTSSFQSSYFSGCNSLRQLLSSDSCHDGDHTTRVQSTSSTTAASVTSTVASCIDSTPISSSLFQDALPSPMAVEVTLDTTFSTSRVILPTIATVGDSIMPSLSIDTPSEPIVHNLPAEQTAPCLSIADTSNSGVSNLVGHNIAAAAAALAHDANDPKVPSTENQQVLPTKLLSGRAFVQKGPTRRKPISNIVCEPIAGFVRQSRSMVPVPTGKSVSSHDILRPADRRSTDAEIDSAAVTTTRQSTDTEIDSAAVTTARQSTDSGIDSTAVTAARHSTDTEIGSVAMVISNRTLECIVSESTILLSNDNVAELTRENVIGTESLVLSNDNVRCDRTSIAALSNDFGNARELAMVSADLPAVAPSNEPAVVASHRGADAAVIRNAQETYSTLEGINKR